MRWVNLLGAAVTAFISVIAVIVVGLLKPAAEVECVLSTPAAVAGPTASATPRPTGTTRTSWPMPNWWPGALPARTATAGGVPPATRTATAGGVPPATRTATAGDVPPTVGSTVGAPTVGSTDGSVPPTVGTSEPHEECRTTDEDPRGAAP